MGTGFDEWMQTSGGTSATAAAAGSNDGGWVNLPSLDSGVTPTGVYEYAPGYRVITGWQTPAADAQAYFGAMGSNDQQRLVGLTWGFVGGQNAPDPSTAEWAWGNAVRYAAAANARDPSLKMSPWDVLEKWAKDGKGGGGGSGGNGSGGGGPRTISQTNYSKSVQKVSVSQAKGLINQALQSLNGRRYSKAEVEKFIEQFNAASAADPQITKSKTTTHISAGGGSQSSSTSSVSSGGIDPQQQAEDFARSRPDYAEFQTAVPLMDAFMQAIQSPVSGG